MAGVSNSKLLDKNIHNISIVITKNIFKIFLFISTYFYFLILKDLIITNKDENVICVIVINKKFFISLHSSSTDWVLIEERYQGDLAPMSKLILQ